MVVTTYKCFSYVSIPVVCNILVWLFPTLIEILTFSDDSSPPVIQAVHATPNEPLEEPEHEHEEVAQSDDVPELLPEHGLCARALYDYQACKIYMKSKNSEIQNKAMIYCHWTINFYYFTVIHKL